MWSDGSSFLCSGIAKPPPTRPTGFEERGVLEAPAFMVVCVESARDDMRLCEPGVSRDAKEQLRKPESERELIEIRDPACHGFLAGEFTVSRLSENCAT